MKIEQRLKSHKKKLGRWRESRKPSPPPAFPSILSSDPTADGIKEQIWLLLSFFPFICFHLSTVCPANDRVIQSFRHATKGQTKEEKSSESLQSVRVKFEFIMSRKFGTSNKNSRRTRKWSKRRRKQWNATLEGQRNNKKHKIII